MEKKINLLILMLSLFVFSIAYTENINLTIGEKEELLNFNLLLGNISDKSVSMSILSVKDIEVYIEYGIQSKDYTMKTNIVKTISGEPLLIRLDNLLPNSSYFYCVRYRNMGEKTFNKGKENKFNTQKKYGTNFSFTVQADSHRDEKTNEELYKTTLRNILRDNPDFHIDLGDTFMTEKFAKTEKEVKERYIEERGYFSIIGESVPLFLVNGNHEGENGWIVNNKKNSQLALWASNARNKYYLNPKADNFFTGDLNEDNAAGKRGGYYSWSWGNALFVVIDPFWYSIKKPSSMEQNWSYTLGKEQYAWLKSTLENSRAKYKFIFSHNLVGGYGKDGRGGIEVAKYFEWGGDNSDGTYGFDTNRTGWEKPIHKLMVDNKVTIFFLGHDHFFAKQELDGVIYQLVPQPGNTGYNNTKMASEYGYNSGIIMAPSGHIKVSVTEREVKVDYIRAYLPKDEKGNIKNGESAYSYTIN